MMQTTNRSCPQLQGRLVAQALGSAWRDRPEPLHLTLTELARVTPYLLRSGAGALAWWRLTCGGRVESTSAVLFRDAWEQHTREREACEEHLARLLRILRTANIEPLLIKGWGLGRLYPHASIRPPGDIDLCVRPDQLTTAVQILRQVPDLACLVDLHSGVPDLGDREWSALIGRSQLVPLGDQKVRLPGPEDHLRLVCIHLARHGAWRPLWLCDVAASLESLSPDFRWNVFLDGPGWLRDWILCILGLAHELLGAHWSSSVQIPDWVRGVVLDQWGAGSVGDSHTRDDRPMWHSLLHPLRFFSALCHRWPNPIEAALRLKIGPNNRWPRTLLQAKTWLDRANRFACRLFTGRKPETDSVAIHRVD